MKKGKKKHKWAHKKTSDEKEATQKMQRGSLKTHPLEKEATLKLHQPNS
jgi:hypothetical protein